ncbi:MAG: ATP-binding protein [Salinivirgaceae bacterium]|nr:ATP-binding protein [Salinivirgaceae bacterium]
MIDSALYEYMRNLLDVTPTAFHRYMYDKIPWNSRLVGILGPRGIGKSTMMLQYLAEHQNEGLHLYVAADNMYFASHTLYGLADDFVKDGGTHLYIDEVHKYKGWARELKQIYDTHPDLTVTFTGSSVLDIYQGEADLSRRALLYTMQGLSFREYLSLFHKVETDVFSLNDILEQKAQIPGVAHPLPLFRKYLETGYYPFATVDGFALRIEQIVAQTIESDIPQYADMKASTARKLKRLLAVVSQLAPFKPNADNLALEVGVSKNNIHDYFVYLEKAGMIGQLRDTTGGLRGLGKTEKVYIDNPTLMTVLASGNPDVGNLRETFFFNQMRVNNDVLSSRVSDFSIGQYTFEVGGKKKGKRQIESIANGIVVRDDIEIGHSNIVPLWAFGLNY